MRKIDYMNVWLADLKLRPNEVVLVWGRQYRHSIERVGEGSSRTENHVLTPVETR